MRGFGIWCAVCIVICVNIYRCVFCSSGLFAWNSIQTRVYTNDYGSRSLSVCSAQCYVVRGWICQMNRLVYI